MKISFDFDGTLEFREVQDFAKELIDRGHDVCILTTRYSDPMSYKWAKSNPEHAEALHNELYEAAKHIGIKEINFTEYQWKTTKIDELGIDIHLDDNWHDEVAVINNSNKAKAVWYAPRGKWKEQIFEIIGRDGQDG